MYSYTVLESWNCIFFSLVLWWASASCLFKAWSVQRWGSEIILVHKPKVRMHSSSLCTYLFSTFLLSACQTGQSRIQLYHLIWLHSACKGVCAITAAVSEGRPAYNKNLLSLDQPPPGVRGRQISTGVFLEAAWRPKRRQNVFQGGICFCFPEPAALVDSPRAEGSLQYRQCIRGCRTDNINSSVEEQASHASTAISLHIYIDIYCLWSQTVPQVFRSSLGVQRP